MGCRCSICRCLIELCRNELVPPLICIRTIPNGGSGVSRASLDKMSSRLQTAEDVWTWIRLYSMTWILIDSNVCVSVCLEVSDICHSRDDSQSKTEKSSWFLWRLSETLGHWRQTQDEHLGIRCVKLLFSFKTLWEYRSIWAVFRLFRVIMGFLCLCKWPIEWLSQK